MAAVILDPRTKEEEREGERSKKNESKQHREGL